MVVKRTVVLIKRDVREMRGRKSGAASRSPTPYGVSWKELSGVISVGRQGADFSEFIVT
jgi:hypothetical protein